MVLVIVSERWDQRCMFLITNTSLYFPDIPQLIQINLITRKNVICPPNTRVVNAVWKSILLWELSLSTDPQDGVQRVNPCFSPGGVKSIFCPGCHSIKPEQDTAFSRPLPPNLQNGETSPSELQGASSPWHPVEKKCYLRDLGPWKREAFDLWALGLGEDRAFSHGILQCLGCRPGS